jgi:hypothetical protein
MKIISQLALAVLLTSCSTVPDWPDEANVRITRPAEPGSILGGLDVVLKNGRVPLAGVPNGETIHGTLGPGLHILSVESADPYAMSEFTGKTWKSRPVQLQVEPGKRYRLEIVPATEWVGWDLRVIGAD